jgi:hypothetical protein
METIFYNEMKALEKDKPLMLADIRMYPAQKVEAAMRRAIVHAFNSGMTGKRY